MFDVDCYLFNLLFWCVFFFTKTGNYGATNHVTHRSNKERHDNFGEERIFNSETRVWSRFVIVRSQWYCFAACDHFQMLHQTWHDVNQFCETLLQIAKSNNDQWSMFHTETKHWAEAAKTDRCRRASESEKRCHAGYEPGESANQGRCEVNLVSSSRKEYVQRILSEAEFWSDCVAAAYLFRQTKDAMHACLNVFHFIEWLKQGLRTCGRLSHCVFPFLLSACGQQKGFGWPEQ